MTRSNVHDAIQRLGPSKRFRVLAFCVMAGIELEDFEDILAEAFTKKGRAEEVDNHEKRRKLDGTGGWSQLLGRSAPGKASGRLLQGRTKANRAKEKYRGPGSSRI